MATIQEVKDYNQQHVDWTKFFSVVDTLGKTMNGQKDRFDKSDIVEMALDAYSNNNILYVNDDGIDHLLLNLYNSKGLPTTQEMKFVGTLFYKEFAVERANKRAGNAGRKELRRSGQTISLKLVNSMGQNTHTSLPVGYAEFLLVADNHSIHVIKVSDLTPYLHFGGDGIEARKVPCDLFTQVVGPADVNNRKSLIDFNYKEEKLKFQRNFLEKFL
jgi:hypothetical protein